MSTKSQTWYFNWQAMKSVLDSEISCSNRCLFRPTSQRKKLVTRLRVAIGHLVTAMQIRIATTGPARRQLAPSTSAAIACTTNALKSRASPCASTRPCPQNKTALTSVVCTTALILRTRNVSDRPVSSVTRLNSANKATHLARLCVTCPLILTQRHVMARQLALK